VTCTVLSGRNEQVDVVGSDVVLGQTDDCTDERSFSVMVCSLLRNVSGELSNLHQTYEIAVSI
jgi:hypothetical protein